MFQAKGVLLDGLVQFALFEQFVALFLELLDLTHLLHKLLALELVGVSAEHLGQEFLGLGRVALEVLHQSLEVVVLQLVGALFSQGTQFAGVLLPQLTYKL